MKKDHPDAQRKKMVGEMLKNADKLLKAGEYEPALAEVEKSLELEPGNFYAQAYKERILALREKHGGAGRAGHTAARESRPVDQAIPQAETIPETEHTHEPVAPEPAADLTEMKEQHARETASQESEATRQAEEIARKALEQEINEGAAAEKMIAAEREATERAIAEGRARARTEFISRSGEEVEKLLGAGDLEGAFTEFARLTIVDPENGKLGDLRARIDDATEKSISPAAEKPVEISRDTIGVIFGNILKAAWREGTPNEAQAGAVNTARTRLEVTPEEEKAIMSKIQREVITEAMREAYRDGDPDPETRAFLDRLTSELAEGTRAVR